MATMYLRKADGTVYGPVELELLVGWAVEGRIGPEDELSEDKEKWVAAVDVQELERFWRVCLQPGHEKNRDSGNFEEEIEHLSAENERMQHEVDRLLKILNEDTDTSEDPVELDVLKKENTRLHDELHKIVSEMKKIRAQRLEGPDAEDFSGDISRKPDKIQQPFMKAAANAMKTRQAATSYTPPVSGLKKRTVNNVRPSLNRHLRPPRRP